MLISTDTFIHARTIPVKLLIWPTLILILIVSGCSRTSRTPNLTNAIGTTPTPAPTLASGQKPEYTVEVEDTEGGPSVHVIFSGLLPAPEEVDKIIRTELEKVRKKNPSIDSSVYACRDDHYCLTLNDYDGDLYYKAATKSILTEDEFQGTKVTTEETDSYLVVTEEHKSAEGITPGFISLSITLVFPQIPPQNVAYDAMVHEIDKARKPGLSIIAFVKAGDKNRKASWYLVNDPDGWRMSAFYNHLTDQIIRGSGGLTVLKTYPREKGN